MKKLLLFATAALMIFTGCNQQSELNVERISGSAKISGRVLYNPGYKADANGTMLAGNQPAAGREVIVEVFYSGAGNPAKLFYAKTDASGVYAMDIPCGPQQVNVQVTPVAFVDTYYKDMNSTTANAPLDIREVSASYSAVAPAAGSISDGAAIMLPDITMAANTTSVIESRTKEVTITGMVFVEKQSPKYADDGSGTIIGLNPSTTESALTTVNVTITYHEPGIADSRKIVFYNQELKEGMYEIKAQLFDVWEYPYVNVFVEAVPYMTDKYIQYYQDPNNPSKYLSRKVEGYYQRNTTSANLDAKVEFTHKYEITNDIVMPFVPTSTNL